jgi:hypothetical protein
MNKIKNVQSSEFMLLQRNTNGAIQPKSLMEIRALTQQCAALIEMTRRTKTMS